jgi:hypothetical protein
VPDDDGPGAARGGCRGQTLDGFASGRRERPARIDVGADGVTMMNEEDMHSSEV